MKNRIEKIFTEIYNGSKYLKALVTKIMQNQKAILSPKGAYHIYNRANGDGQLFLSEENYRYFLRKYDAYIYPNAHTFCYCLMPNHFHFLIRIKEEKQVKDFFKDKLKKLKPQPNLQGFENLEGLISRQFSNFFNAYSKAFNKQNNRKGNLFMHNFKRKLITDEAYFRKLVHYIHYNPIKAGLGRSLEDWKYSSYQAITSKRQTKLRRKETIKYFNDIENFIYCHQQLPSLTGIE